MQKTKGLFVGLATVDIQYFVESFPKANKKIKSQSPLIHAGGPASNAAVAFANSGGKAFLVSASGKNSFSEFIHNDLSSTGVEYIDLVEGQEYNPVLAATVTSLANGDRNVFTYDPSPIYTEKTPDELINSIQPDILLTDGFLPEFSIDCVRIAKTNNIPVVLDCGSWKPQFEQILDFADVVICSEDFFPPECGNSEQVVSFLKEKNIKQFAISGGDKPILLFAGKERGEVIINKVNVIDTLGAGDILHGVFCFEYLRGGHFLEALRRASEVATLSCRFKGTREWINYIT